MQTLLHVILGCLLLLVAACAPVGDPARPNVVVFVADDLSWDDLGAYGQDFLRTPNIDALARDGLRFDAAFLTTSSCSASRASILTGLYPHSTGAPHLHQALPRDKPTIASHLRGAGYFTVAAGKWHLGTPATRGFNKVIDQPCEESGATTWLDVLRRRPRGRPFFLWLAACDPHRPFSTAADDLPPAYRPEEIALPWGFVEGEGTRRELAAYYREVSRFDSYVGKVLEELRTQQVLENTLVIVLADNGRPFHLGKLTLYDPGIRTPLILHWPRGIAEAGGRDALVSSVDLAPGILELAGIPVPPSMQGYSFLPLLDDPDATIRDVIVAERNWHGRDAHERAVRSARFLYKQNQHPDHGHCHNSQFGYSPAFRDLQAARRRGELEGWLLTCFEKEWPREELYDLWENAWRDVSTEPAYRAQLDELREILRQWRAATGDRDFEPHTSLVQ